jgi:large repetitive protein
MANTHSLDLENGSSQYASITDGSQTGLDITGDMTIECWFKPENDVNSTQGLVTKWDESGNQRSYALIYNDIAATPELRFNISDDGSASEVMIYAQTLTLGTWYHLAVAWTASTSTAQFYINGVNVGSDSGAMTSAFSGSGSFVVGCRDLAGTPKGFVDGLVEEVRVWDDIRTAQEIVDNMYTELAGNEANLQGYWKLNNDYTDETSNGNDLTASGSPVFSTSVPWTTTNTKSLDLEATSDQYASNASTSGLTITGDMTIEFWAKPESLAYSTWIIDSGTAGSETEADNTLFQVKFNSDSSMNWLHEYSTGTNESKSSTTTPVVVGAWHHYAWVRDTVANDIRYYFDGVLNDTVAYTNEATGGATGNKMWVGVNTNATAGVDYDGLLDEIRIWDVARTVDQIAAAKDTAIKQDHANLQACYALDDGYLDETANSNDLTATGSPTFNADVPFPIVASITATGTNMYIIL